MLYESASKDVLDFPDNVTTSARGHAGGVRGRDQPQLPARPHPQGELFDIAQNRIATQLNDEFAGSTFSPDGETLFVNIQASLGVSLAIWGPWGRIGV